MNFTTINGHTIHYRYEKRAGQRTYVFANSLGTDLRIWDDVVALLAPEDSILRFDKPGHGLSSVPDNKLTISDYADIAVALLDQLHIDTCVFVGLSIGGLIGQRLAVMHPERIDKLVLSNTAPQIGTADGWNDRIQTVEQQGISAIAEGVLERWFSQKFRYDNPTRMAGYRILLEQTSKAGYVRACEAVRDEDLTAQIGQLTMPTLCIGGSDDGATPPELVQAMADIIPGATCHIIDGVGHIPCLQTPELVAQLILDFVAMTPTDGSRESLYQTGMNTRRSVLGNAHVDRAEANKTELDVDFQRYITESAWGMVWSRPGLTKRERSMLTIALMTALGHKDELAMHIRATKNTGTTPDDIKEVLLHTAIYAGAPAALSALKVTKDVLAEKES